MGLRSIGFYMAATLAVTVAGARAQDFSTTEFKAELQKGIAQKLGANSGVTVTYMAASSVTQDIQQAVQAVADTTDYIADHLCKKRSRPTKITLHLTAGFKLVFEGETGSEVEWDLETVCARFPDPTE
jgi:hypothetical protein